MEKPKSAYQQINSALTPELKDRLSAIYSTLDSNTQNHFRQSLENIGKNANYIQKSESLLRRWFRSKTDKTNAKDFADKIVAFESADDSDLVKQILDLHRENLETKTINGYLSPEQTGEKGSQRIWDRVKNFASEAGQLFTQAPSKRAAIPAVLSGLMLIPSTGCMPPRFVTEYVTEKAISGVENVRNTVQEMQQGKKASAENLGLIYPTLSPNEQNIVDDIRFWNFLPYRFQNEDRDGLNDNKFVSSIDGLNESQITDFLIRYEHIKDRLMSDSSVSPLSKYYVISLPQNKKAIDPYTIQKTVIDDTVRISPESFQRIKEAVKYLSVKNTIETNGIESLDEAKKQFVVTEESDGTKKLYMNHRDQDGNLYTLMQPAMLNVQFKQIGYPQG